MPKEETPHAQIFCNLCVSLSLMISKAGSCFFFSSPAGQGEHLLSLLKTDSFEDYQSFVYLSSS